MLILIATSATAITPRVDAGGAHTILLKNDASVWAWGSNDSGQLGDGTTTERELPVQVTGITGDVRFVHANDSRSFAVTAQGILWAWGSNWTGQLGDGTTTDRHSPVQVPGLTDVVAVAARFGRTYALRSDGTVWWWGDDYQGGPGQLTPVQVPGLTGVTQIVAGGGHAAALRNDGTVWAWGFNGFGQSGNGTTTPSEIPGPVSRLRDVVQLASGEQHVLALRADGTVWGWGYKFDGQLGFGDQETTRWDGCDYDFDTDAFTEGCYAATPVRVDMLNEVIAIAAGGGQSFALGADGSVWKWGLIPIIGFENYSPVPVLGANGSGWDEDVFFDPSPPHFAHNLGNDVAAVAAGGRHVVALKSDGAVWSWGENSDGQVGDGSFTDRNDPVRTRADCCTDLAAGSLGPLPPIVFGSSGGALDAGVHTGRLRGVDLNGDSMTYRIATPPAQGSATIVDEATGEFTYIADAGATGTDSFTVVANDGALDSAPVHVRFTFAAAGLAPQLAASLASVAMLRTDGTVWTWGEGFWGQRGSGNRTDANFAEPVQGPDGVLGGVIAIANSGEHMIALKADGTVWAWGHNSDGQLGDGTKTNRPTPVQVQGLSGVQAVAAGNGISFAITAAGDVKAWGWLESTESTAPIDYFPDELQGVTSLNTSQGFHRLAVLSDGTLKSWGLNDAGQLGDGSTVLSAVPATVLDLPPVKAAAGGSYHSLVLDIGGALHAWGANQDGRLGDDTTTQRLTPVAVQGLEGERVVAIAAGQEHSVALTENGGVWTWGENQYGALGDGSNTDRRLPVSVPGMQTGVAAIAAGASPSNFMPSSCHSQTVVVKTDGSVWSWGCNSSGQLGTQVWNSATGFPYTFHTSPVRVERQLPGNPWDLATAPLDAVVGNPRPTARDAAFLVDDDASHSGMLVATDPADDGLVYSIVTSPARGVVTIDDPRTGAFTYTPQAGTSGPDSFTFKANDGFRDSNVARITFTVRETGLPHAEVHPPCEEDVCAQVFVISGTASDAVSGLDRVELQITDGTFYLTQQQGFTTTPVWIAAAGTSEWSFDTSQALWTSGSTYTITARAHDRDDNRFDSAPVSFSFFEGERAFTRVAIPVMSRTSIEFGEALSSVGVKLSKPGDSGFNLSGNPVDVEVYDPSGTLVGVLRTRTNANGASTISGIGGDIDACNGEAEDLVANEVCVLSGAAPAFDASGAWTLNPVFPGSIPLKPAPTPGAESPRIVLVGESAGYVVLVQGKLPGVSADGLDDHNYTTNRIYDTLIDRGFFADEVFYFNYAPLQPGVDGVPDKCGLKRQILGSAALTDDDPCKSGGNVIGLAERVAQKPAPVYIVYADHGGDGVLFLDDEVITASELASWIDALETQLDDLGVTWAMGQRPRTVLILGACYSGGFIEKLSGPGRLVIASAAANEESYKGGEVDAAPVFASDPDTPVVVGEFFLDELFNALERGENFRSAFVLATAGTEDWTRRDDASERDEVFLDGAVQHPLLDDNADGVGSNEFFGDSSEGALAERLVLGFAPRIGTNSIVNPADIDQVTGTCHVDEFALGRPTHVPQCEVGTGEGAVPVAVWLTPTAATQRELAAGLIEVRPPGETLQPAHGTEQLTRGGVNGLPREVLDVPLEVEDPPRYRTTLDLAALSAKPGRYEIFYWVQDDDTGNLSPTRRSVVYRVSAGNAGAPPAPSLLLPVEGARTGDVVVFDWQDVEDPQGVTYTLRLSKNPDMSAPEIEQHELRVSSGVVAGIDTEGNPTWWWQVEAVDGEGLSRRSAIRSFEPRSDVNSGTGIIRGVVRSDRGLGALTAVSVATHHPGGGERGLDRDDGYIFDLGDGSFILLTQGGSTDIDVVASAAGALAQRKTSIRVPVCSTGASTGRRQGECPEAVRLNFRLSPDPEVAGRADLAVEELTAAPNPAEKDALLEYSMRIANAGSSSHAARGVRVTVELPGTALYEGSEPECSTPRGNTLRCPLADLAPGAHQALRIQVTPTADDVVLGLVASVQSDRVDENPVNDVAAISVAVGTEIQVGDDPDGDGLSGGLDNCPSVPNANQDDLDEDGQGDACDDDIDGDGIDNEVETVNGLDERDARDADRDADGDDFSNLEEVVQGTDLNDRGDWPMPVMVSSDDLTGHTETFEWHFPTDLLVRQWEVRVGSTAGGRQILGPRRLQGDARTFRVNRLPTVGGEVYVTLRINRGRGFRNAKTFAFSAALLPAPALSPGAGPLDGMQSGDALTFTLERNGHDVTQWRVEVFEPSSSGRDRRVYRRVLRGDVDEVTVTRLPTFGELLGVRLGYRLSGRGWRYRNEAYRAVRLPEPALVTPDPRDGSAQLLSTPNNAAGTGMMFGWTANGQPVNRWRLQVGTTRGGRELYRSRRLRGDVRSVDTRRVFAQGPVWVRLYYRIGRVERFVDYQYQPRANTLRALYPSTAGLGLIAPVRNDGQDAFSATGRLCRGTERGGHEACLPGGLMRVLTLPVSVAGCDAVTVMDALDAFEWVCRETVPVEVVSVGLKGSFIDLIDTSVAGAPALRANQVIVEDGGMEVARSALEAWWTTPVESLPADGVMREADTVYVVEDGAPGVQMLANRAARSLLLVSPGVTAPVTGAGTPGGAVVRVLRAPFAVVSGRFASTGESTVVLVDRSAFARVDGVEATGGVTLVAGRRVSPGTGVGVTRSHNVRVSRTTASGNEAVGIALERSTGVWVVHSAALANGVGVDVHLASGNTLHDVRARHNAGSGIVVERSSDNRLHRVVVSNNGTQVLDGEAGGHGVEVVHASSRRNVLGFVQAFNNAGDGVLLDGARNTRVHHVTSFNHPGGGVVLARAFDSMLASVLTLNNGEFGLGLVDGTQRTQVVDLAAAHNAVGVALSGRARRNVFAGVLKVGGNGADCAVEAGSGDLLDGSCAAVGGSTHNVTTGIDAADTLIGARDEGGPGDDGVESFEALMAAPALLEDLGAGEGSFSARGYGRDGGVFPDADQRGPCVSGVACRVWDGSLASGDGGDGGSPVAAGMLAMPGAEDVVRHRTRGFETFLLHASETLFDGLGDDDGGCESGEDCHLELNLGAFQGEAGDGIAEEVIGFVLEPAARNAAPRVEDVGLDARTGTTVNGAGG